MINDGANPLAEVALALAMAFFSLMILMLFAMVNAPKTDSTRASPATVDMAFHPRDHVHVDGPPALKFPAKGILQHLLDTQAGLGAGGYCLCGINTDNLLDFLLHPLGVGLR